VRRTASAISAGGARRQDRSNFVTEKVNSNTDDIFTGGGSTDTLQQTVVQ
jgi:hypothetical protein